jgi:hypothetical protein
MAILSGGRCNGASLTHTFAFSLVPIAIAYHIAHYLSFLLVQGQRIIPLLSDPFGFGWNLLGTAGYRINIGIVDAGFGWSLRSSWGMCLLSISHTWWLCERCVIIPWPYVVSIRCWF